MTSVTIKSSFLLLCVLLLYGASSVRSSPGLLVVLYSYPADSGNTTWTAIRDAAVENPTLPIMAIINPSSGPGKKIDKTYYLAIQDLVDVGITCIGYVATGYGKVSTSSVQSQMKDYKDWYPMISGFFLDEMANKKGFESYYKSITDYAVSIGYGYTMGNPGTTPLASYLGTVNNTVIYETSPLPTPSSLDLSSIGYTSDICSLIVYNIPASQLNQTYITEVSQYVSWIWITDLKLPNPYDGNPSYLSTEIAYLLGASIFTPSTSSTSSTSSSTSSTSSTTGLKTTRTSTTGKSRPKATPRIRSTTSTTHKKSNSSSSISRGWQPYCQPL